MHNRRRVSCGTVTRWRWEGQATARWHTRLFSPLGWLPMVGRVRVSASLHRRRLRHDRRYGQFAYGGGPTWLERFWSARPVLGQDRVRGSRRPDRDHRRARTARGRCGGAWLQDPPARLPGRFRHRRREQRRVDHHPLPARRTAARARRESARRASPIHEALGIVLRVHVQPVAGAVVDPDLPRIDKPMAIISRHISCARAQQPSSG